MSRSRKPIEMQNRHLTNAEKIEKEQQEEIITLGKEHLEHPPDWLIDEIAVNEFYRIVHEIDKINLLGNLDVNNLGGYCNSYAFYIRATEELKGKRLILKKFTKNGPVTIENPLIKIQKNYADEMRKFASLCGMTIDSRLKAATINVNKQDEEISDEFGDI